MKGKLIFLSCVCALWCASALAQEVYRTVLVTTAQGNVLHFDLAEGVDVTFTDTEMKITASASEVALPLTDFARFDFSTQAGGVAQVDAPVNVCISNGVLSVSGLVPCSFATIYAIDGCLVCSGQADASGQFSSITLNQGVYVFQSKVNSFKFFIK